MNQSRRRHESRLRNHPKMRSKSSAKSSKDECRPSSSTKSRLSSSTKAVKLDPTAAVNPSRCRLRHQPRPSSVFMDNSRSAHGRALGNRADFSSTTRGRKIVRLCGKKGGQCVWGGSTGPDRLGRTRSDSDRLGQSRTDANRLGPTRWIDSDRLGQTRINADRQDRRGGRRDSDPGPRGEEPARGPRGTHRRAHGAGMRR